MSEAGSGEGREQEKSPQEGRDRDRDRSRDFRIDDKLRQRLESLVPEVVRRTFFAGLGAVFTTEEGIRKLAQDVSLPKDAANFLVQQAQATKNELFRIVAGEVRGFLESLNLNEELQRLLTSLSFEIKTEIRFIPNDQKLVKPNVKNRVKVKRKLKDDEPPVEVDLERLGQEEPMEADGVPPDADEEG